LLRRDADALKQWVERVFLDNKNIKFPQAYQVSGGPPSCSTEVERKKLELELAYAGTVSELHFTCASMH